MIHEEREWEGDRQKGDSIVGYPNSSGENWFLFQAPVSRKSHLRVREQSIMDSDWTYLHSFCMDPGVWRGACLYKTAKIKEIDRKVYLQGKVNLLRIYVNG